MLRTSSLIALLLLAFASGCRPAPVDASADVSAIQQANQRYIEMHPRGALDELVALYTPDAILLPPDGAPITGRPSIRQYCATFFVDWEVVEAQSTIDEVIVAGDWAYSRGHFTETTRSRDGGTTIAETGKFSGLWQRGPSDGMWRIARDMWNATPPRDLASR
jgi:ketosteroid isomerase-like protein